MFTCHDIACDMGLTGAGHKLGSIDNLQSTKYQSHFANYIIYASHYQREITKCNIKIKIHFIVFKKKKLNFLN